MDPKNKYNVAVLGWWYGKNYGSILTYYGLNRAIENLGRSVLMIHEPLGYNGFRVRWPDDILSMDFARRTGYQYTEQMHYSQLGRLNELADTFVVGSDQLWNPLIGRVNDDLFLDFVAPDRNRVAYGTSFGNRGTEKFKPEFIAKHAQNLQKFKAISVRENYGIDTARNIFGAKADLVVDPVFLLDQNHYSELSAKATISPEGQYMAVFFLDPTPEKKSTALAILEKTGLEKILVICNPDEGRTAAQEIWAEEPRAEIIKSDSPENFLRGYQDSSYVVTDSFHGTAFSVIFEKPFSSIYNDKRGADRFKNLLSSLGFGDTRRVYESDTAETINANDNVSLDIDFAKARNYVENGRKTSLEWLDAALDPAVKSSAALESGKAVIDAASASVQSHTLDLDFSANSDIWAITKGKDGVSLRVTSNSGLSGKHTWVNLRKPLEKGTISKIKISWAPRTVRTSVNLHLRSAETGQFKVLGALELSNASGENHVSELVFKSPGSEYNQLMLGAVHFTGSNPGAKISKIEIYPASQQDWLSTKKTQPLKAATQKSSIAIPPNTPDREQIVLNVLNDDRVRKLKDELLILNPSLKIYIGRELKEYTHNKVGGPADILTFPTDIEEIAQLVEFALENDVPYMLLGRGSNVIVRDGGIRGIVIMSTGIDHFSLKDGEFTVGAGASFIEASYYLLEHGLSTLEWASGIPGTVGGAVYMNAGTNVSDIRSTIKSVKFIDHRGRLKELQKNEISWGKRYTTFHEHPNWIIVEATFSTSPSDRIELSKKMLATVQVRERHFPLENPNHGSTFKWWRAPRLLMQAGLQGYRIGGAQISTKQPGFFVNVNQATAADYEALIDYAIAKVYELSGFLLEPEVEIIGERPHRYERYSEASSTTDLERKVVGPQA
ncbi:UDP-N-acetylmuramate dehydrogenase [Glutamicibacter arilaitensis]|uniref:UDP-N-acetylmuramate dehydrogenase n=1 Tax=Glutamicibacter arilaitensis TaxID=256701 RepID=UPI003FD4C5E1